MQLEDERRHADQYKEQNEKVNIFFYQLVRLCCKTGTGHGSICVIWGGGGAALGLN